MVSGPDDDALVALAAAARKNAYAPHSRLEVGAAVRARDGRCWVGVNVENVSYGLTICAERSALAAAVAGGAKRGDIDRVVVVTEAGHAPCGACRQVILELAPAAEVLVATPRGVVSRHAAAALLPAAFTRFVPGAGQR